MSIYPESLTSHFGREVTTVCHCWRLTRKDGSVTGYTDHDRALTVGGIVYAPETGFSASEARDTLGLAVDTVDVEGALSSERISEEDIAAGLYDGASVETLLVNWRKPADFALIRTATIGKITRSDQRFIAELESMVHTLDQPGGRYVSRSCDAELADARCRFSADLPGFSAVGAVGSQISPSGFTAFGLEAFSAGWFSHGVLTWTSGARSGRSERIDEHRMDATGVTLVLRPRAGPMPEPGDTFSVFAGCDKTFATCKAKFDNALNFRGFPHLPGNDAAYAYVVDGGRFDGGPLVS